MNIKYKGITKGISMEFPSNSRVFQNKFQNISAGIYSANTEEIPVEIFKEIDERILEQITMELPKKVFKKNLQEKMLEEIAKAIGEDWSVNLNIQGGSVV